MKFYCLHHLPAVNRRLILEKEFEKRNFQVEWVTGFRPEEIIRSDLIIDHELNDAALSLYLKHQYVLKKSYKEGIGDFVVFEDDVILSEFLTLSFLETVMHEFHEMDGDILNIGTAFNMRPTSLISGKLVYHEPHFTTRCAHAYSISHKCLRRILPELSRIDDAWDWKLNHLIKKFNLKSCYMEPGIRQASLDGGLESLLR